MCGLLSALFFNTFRSSGVLSQASYARLRPQMRCESLIASPRKDFSVLAMVTECWAPAAGCWVGDYPYLQRKEFRAFAAEALATEGQNSGLGDDTREPVEAEGVGRGRGRIDTVLQVPVASATTAAVAAAAPGVSVVERTRGRARGSRSRSEGAETSSVATAAADPVGDIRSWLDAVDDAAAEDGGEG